MVDYQNTGSDALGVDAAAASAAGDEPSKTAEGPPSRQVLIKFDVNSRAISPRIIDRK